MTLRQVDKDTLLRLIRDGKPMSRGEQLWLTTLLSVPAMLAQLGSIVMQYIDAMMVGSLGADDSASIGLVSTTLWLFGGICSAVASGFTVQVAHRIGARDNAGARDVLRQSIVASLVISLILCAVGCLISGPLPRWLGGHEIITANASRYFLIFMLGIPWLTIEFLAGGMLRATGNIKVPSLLNVLMCALDVVFNFFLIFPTRDLTLLGMTITVPGAGLGVTGAAMGTILAEVLVCMVMFHYLLTRCPELRLGQDSGSYVPRADCLNRAGRIGFPMGLQHLFMCSAHIIITAIVAPLGSVAIAANAFGITAESLCYMPGYGIGEAATTLVGQSVGARRRDLARSFGFITVGLGMIVMAVMAVLLYVGAPVVMAMFSPVAGVVDLGTRCLRIEAFAEPLFGAAIVCYGVFVGAGDTLVPSGMNLLSMWAVRLTLAAVLVGSMGLVGVWLAMSVELCCRGSLFLLRLRSQAWLKTVKENK